MEKVRASGLKKYYGEGANLVKALDGVDISVEEGEFVAILGSSGSGKTTLLNMLGGLDLPTDGNVWVDGTALGNMDKNERTVFRREKIGFIFQAYNLLPMLTAYENIVLPLRLDGQDIKKEFLDRIIETLGLGEKRNNFPHEMSGGQQQRVAIGRALITRPKLILADEPTGNLDRKNSQDVMELLTKASGQFQQTILMITHNPNLITSVDRVMQVSDGILTDLGGNDNEKLS